MWQNGRGARRIFWGLKFQLLVSLGVFFASRLKPIMVSFRVSNFHDLIERLTNFSNLISKCSNLFDFVMHTDI